MNDVQRCGIMLKGLSLSIAWCLQKDGIAPRQAVASLHAVADLLELICKSLAEYYDRQSESWMLPSLISPDEHFIRTGLRTRIENIRSLAKEYDERLEKSNDSAPYVGPY